VALSTALRCAPWDAAYRWSASLIDWARRELGVELQVVKRSDDLTGFHVLPRWVVERTFGWLTHCRRLCRDYERLTAHAEDFIKLAMIRQAE
jgi:transposase